MSSRRKPQKRARVIVVVVAVVVVVVVVVVGLAVKTILIPEGTNRKTNDTEDHNKQNIGIDINIDTVKELTKTERSFVAEWLRCCE